MENIKRSERKFKIAALALVAVLLIWLPFEDPNEGWVIAYAGAICALAGMRYVLISANNRGQVWVRHVLAGLIAGLALTPVALLLMAFKTGLHIHDTPDFTAFQMARVVELTPIWVSAGLLVGLGSGLWRAAKLK